MVIALTSVTDKVFAPIFEHSQRTSSLASTSRKANKLLQEYFPQLEIGISGEYDRTIYKKYKNFLLVYGQIFIRDLPNLERKLSSLNIELPSPKENEDDYDRVYDLFSAFFEQKIKPLFEEYGVEIRPLTAIRGNSGGNNPCWDFLYPW